MKYEFTGETLEYSGKFLNRIRSLIDIPEHNVKIGDLGGWVEDRFSLAQVDASWVADESKVLDKGRVIGNALIENNSVVKDNGKVQHNAKISQTAIKNNGAVFGNAVVKESLVCDDAKVCGNSIVVKSRMFGGSNISGNAKLILSETNHTVSIKDNAEVYQVILENGCQILNSAKVSSEWKDSQRRTISNNSIITNTFDDNCQEIIFNCNRWRMASYSGYEIVDKKKIYYITSISRYGVYIKTVAEWSNIKPEKPYDPEYMKSYNRTIQIVNTIIMMLIDSK